MATPSFLIHHNPSQRREDEKTETALFEDTKCCCAVRTRTLIAKEFPSPNKVPILSDCLQFVRQNSLELIATFNIQKYKIAFENLNKFHNCDDLSLAKKVFYVL